MTPPTTTDAFLDLLEKSHLLSSEQYLDLDFGVEDDNPNSKNGIARRLTKEGLLTTFQARQLLHGRYKGFFHTEKYKILDVIGEGGMGRVLLCEHLMLQRLVALKILNFHGEPPPPGTAERFLREARAAAALDHPNITRVFDADYGPGGPFLVMEYVDGSNLHQVVADHGRLSVSRAANYTYQVALALTQADKMGLVHRDIKPGNILVNREGQIKLLDLGLARFQDDGKNESLTKRFDARNVLGTADFIAPEQTQNSSRVDIRADIYSLGCSLYFLLTRRLPFEEGTITQKLLWHQSRDLPEVAEEGVTIPLELNNILKKMTQKQPEDRFQTPAELADALERWQKIDELPAEQEMPKVHANSYRLGLSPSQPKSKPPITESLNSPTVTTPRTGNRPLTPQRIPSPKAMQATEEFADHQENHPDQIDATSLEIPLQPGLTPEEFLLSNINSPRRPVPVRPLPPAVERSFRRWIILAVVLTALVSAGFSVLAYQMFIKPGKPTSNPIAAESPEVRGAGSSLIQSLMNAWIDEYSKKAKQNVKYTATGSGNGIDLLIRDGTLFAATDAPLTQKQLDDAKTNFPTRKLLTIPLAISAVSVAYNVPVESNDWNLVLDGPSLGKIYNGEITTWSHQDIVKLNPNWKPKQPGLDIFVGVRKDASGTSAIFTDFLSLSYPTIAKEFRLIGEPSTSVLIKFRERKQLLKTRVGNRNENLAEELQKEEGAIGYLDHASATQHKLRIAKIINSSGERISPEPVSIQQAAEDLPADFSWAKVNPAQPPVLVNTKDKDAYPITGITFAVFFDQQKQPDQKKALIDFFSWVMENGAVSANEKQFGSLTPRLKQEALKILMDWEAQP